MGQAFRFGFIIPAPLEVEVVELQIHSRPLGLLNRFNTSLGLLARPVFRPFFFFRLEMQLGGRGMSSVERALGSPLSASTKRPSEGRNCYPSRLV